MNLREGARGGGMHAPAAIDRADEIDGVEGARSNQPFGIGVVEMQALEHAFGSARGTEGFYSHLRDRSATIRLQEE